MASASSPSGLIKLRELMRAGFWEAYLLPVSAFPIPEPELVEIGGKLDQFIGAVHSSWGLSSEVFLQLEQLKPDEARAVMSSRASKWIPEVGLGVWPDRQPPEIWTQEEISSMGPGDRLRPLMFQVFQITASAEAKTEARKAMLRFGAYMEILTRGSSSEFFERTNAYFLSKIRDRSYRSFPIYIPLIEEKTLRSSKLEDLEAWMGGASIYIRQSFEDQGLLILSDLPVIDIFTDLRMTKVNPAS